MQTSQYTGDDLYLLRASRRVRQADVARAWGCSRQNIARVEASRRLTSESVRRYMSALALADAGR